jgi:hypothetical protein
LISSRDLIPPKEVANSRQQSLDEVCAGLAERLRARRDEIVQAINSRIEAREAVPLTGEDVECQVERKAVVADVVDYSLSALEHGSKAAVSIPLELLARTRSAARGGLSLETVVCRHVAAHKILSGFVVAEANRLSTTSLRQVLDIHGAQLEDLVRAAMAEYLVEQGRLTRSPEEALIERVDRLLANEPVDTTEIDYDFAGWHLGIVMIGGGSSDAIRALAQRCGYRFLPAGSYNDAQAGWLGSGRAHTTADVESALATDLLRHVRVALGEPGNGLRGWRITHWQATEALSVALHSSQTLTRYADVAMLAPALQSEMRAASLKEIYLMPLDRSRESGGQLADTIRQYLDAGGNITATAAKLGVDRRTVHNHLRMIEERLGCQIHTRLPELAVALRLEQLATTTPP